MKNNQIIRVWKLTLVLLVFIPVFYLNGFPQQVKLGEEIPFSITFSAERQGPLEVPVVPSLSQKNPYFFGGLDTRLATKDDYQPSGDGAFIKENEKST